LNNWDDPSVSSPNSCSGCTRGAATAVHPLARAATTTAPAVATPTAAMDGPTALVHLFASLRCGPVLPRNTPTVETFVAIATRHEQDSRSTAGQRRLGTSTCGFCHRCLTCPAPFPVAPQKTFVQCRSAVRTRRLCSRGDAGDCCGGVRGQDRGAFMLQRLP